MTVAEVPAARATDPAPERKGTSATVLEEQGDAAPTLDVVALQSDAEPISSVRVSRGDTLGHIASVTTASIAAIIDRIQRVNPSLTDVNVLDIGERIVLPAGEAHQDSPSRKRRSER